MVALYHRRRTAGGRDALDNVGIEGALGEKGGAFDFAGLALEELDEQPADRLALGFWVGDPGQRAKEIFSRINVQQGNVVVVAEEVDDLPRLVAAQQAGVDKDAGELFADRLVDQHRGDRGVDPAGETADHPPLADLGADGADRFGAERGHGPVAGEARDAVGEVAQDHGAAGRVSDLGVELDAIDPPRLVGDRREGRAGGGGDYLEAGRDGGDLVAMAHPHRLVGARTPQVGQERRVANDMDVGAAELAGVAALHRPAELGAEGHFAIADTQDRNPEREQAGVGRRALAVVGASRTARQDHRRRRVGQDRPGGLVVGRDLAIDAALAQAPGDELGHLTAEIDDQNLLAGRHGPRP